MRKSLRILVIAALVLTVVTAALAKTVKTSEGIVLPIVSKPVTYTWMLGDHPDHPFDEGMFVWKEFAKRTNILIDFMGVPEQNFDEKRAAVLGSRNLPHMMRVDLAIAKRFGVEGAFLPLEELIDKYTKVLKTKMDEEIRKELRAGNGKIYSIPTLQSELISTGWNIRGDWLQKLGLKEPETIEDYYNVLVAFRDRDPDGNGIKDTIPLTHRSILEGFFQTFAYAFGTKYVVDHESWMPENGRMVYTPTSDRFKEMLQFINRLYKEDLLDKEFANNQSTAIWQEKLLNNKAGAFMDWMTRTDFFTNAAKASGKIPGYKMIAIKCPKGPHGDSACRVKREARHGQSMALSSKLSKQDAINLIKYFDYRFSADGILLNNYGIEGMTFTYVNGLPRHIASIRKDPAGRVLRTAAGQDYGMCLPNNCQQEINIPDAIGEQTRAAWKKVGYDIDKNVYEKDRFVQDNPELPYTVAEQEIVLSKMATIQPRQEEWMVQFITGQRSFSEWDKFKAAMKDLGVDEVMKAVDAAYQRYLAASKK